MGIAKNRAERIGSTVVQIGSTKLEPNSDNDIEVKDTSNNRKKVIASELRVGTGNDIEIYHSSGQSYITNSTGNFRIDADHLRLRSKTGTESFISANLNGAVELYHNNAKKLDTTAYGIEVTGTVGTDTLIVTGVSTVASLIFSAGTNTNGVSYFDANGQVQSTVSPASGISTSNSILTTNASGVPIWTDTIDCGTF